MSVRRHGRVPRHLNRLQRLIDHAQADISLAGGYIFRADQGACVDRALQRSGQGHRQIEQSRPQNLVTTGLRRLRQAQPVGRKVPRRTQDLRVVEQVLRRHRRQANLHGLQEVPVERRLPRVQRPLTDVPGMNSVQVGGQRFVAHGRVGGVLQEAAGQQALGRALHGNEAKFVHGHGTAVSRVGIGLQVSPQALD